MVEANEQLRPFLRDKLFTSVYESVRHRKTALSDATALTDTIIRKLLAVIENGQTTTQLITTITTDVLKRFDTAAAVHYGAYHPLAD